MANFTIADIKALREQLGTGMVDTKKALEEADGDVDKATEMLRKVLAAEPNNLYAANGLGVVCVAKGRLNDARSIFTQVAAAAAFSHLNFPLLCNRTGTTLRFARRARHVRKQPSTSRS